MARRKRRVHLTRDHRNKPIVSSADQRIGRTSIFKDVAFTEANLRSLIESAQAFDKRRRFITSFQVVVYVAATLKDGATVERSATVQTLRDLYYKQDLHKEFLRYKRELKKDLNKSQIESYDIRFMRIIFRLNKSSKETRDQKLAASLMKRRETIARNARAKKAHDLMVKRRDRKALREAGLLPPARKRKPKK